MFSSGTYLQMFRELRAIHGDPGPLNKTWCNVPLAKYHKLQATKILSGSSVSSVTFCFQYNFGAFYFFSLFTNKE
jgi:hypothetical protein